MIRDIGNKITLDNDKHNWIDQNNVVFGYDDDRKCCEYWGWGVYDRDTGEKVADDPNELPYHFDFSRRAKVGTGRCIRKYTEEDTDDIVQVTLVHDYDPRKELIFECFNCHNGYYYHDFSFKRIEEEKA